MMKFTLEGNDCMPPISGGYLLIYRGSEEITVVSVPSPNFMVDRYRDSVSENYDSFEDEKGNKFNINIWSSNVGVDWTLDVETEDGTLKEQIRVEYHANEF
ncbi:hypothetical protein [Photobacterium iliopiscarium]|uniref:hypothetical protein n=1 Tax=Photobacterium iliopiscarium TaxID=56192 RepID=UPI0005D40007|nr:hypothetical protein [Photobacterium iliopiscarium]KJG13572.1 hypothetical protein UB38_09150 [Photobacterium iliopiscarium]PST99589.1 hypothetical protein C9I85_10240 [Photobacterium iliopiscarium]PSV82913.1 hypothetical protein C9J51_10265 [Photobacterium iliopiscarium]